MSEPPAIEDAESRAKVGLFQPSGNAAWTSEARRGRHVKVQAHLSVINRLVAVSSPWPLRLLIPGDVFTQH